MSGLQNNVVCIRVHRAVDPHPPLNLGPFGSIFEGDIFLWGFIFEGSIFEGVPACLPALAIADTR